MKYLITILFFATLLFSCKEGTEIDDLAPETTVFLDSINLEDENRLTTVVELHWHGSDQDGYVTGYEITTNGTTWVFTTKTDSIFQFQLEEGETEKNILFEVRAIDNDDQKDLTPAQLTIPVQNSKPIIELNEDSFVTDTAFVLFSAIWEASDPDGDNTIDSIYIKLNDSEWYALEPTVNFITVSPTDTRTTGEQQATVSYGTQDIELSTKLEGLKLADWNKLYLKAKDISGSYSEVDTSVSFYLKEQTSDLLLVNNNGDGFTPANSIYFPIVQSTYGNFDAIDFTTNDAKNYPIFFNPTFERLISIYDKVFIYSDALERNNSILLEDANSALTKFQTNGGKLLIAADLPANLDDNSVLFQLTPMDSLKTTNKSLRIVTDSIITPLNINSTLDLDLQASRIITGADPFYVKSNATPLFRSYIVQSGEEWDGPNTVCAKLTNSNGQTNQIFWSINLHVLTARDGTLKNVFRHIFENEFNW